MCSIATNKTFDDILFSKALPAKQAKAIEKRLIEYARAANVNTKAAGLDDNSGSLKHMPEELRGIKHKQICRHRVYYTGYHTECHYYVGYLKVFKRDGKDSESDKVFQKKLQRWFSEKPSRFLCLPDES